MDNCDPIPSNRVSRSFGPYLSQKGQNATTKNELTLFSPILKLKKPKCHYFFNFKICLTQLFGVFVSVFCKMEISWVKIFKNTKKGGYFGSFNFKSLRKQSELTFSFNITFFSELFLLLCTKFESGHQFERCHKKVVILFTN